MGELIRINEHLYIVDNSKIKENSYYINNKVLFLSDTEFNDGNNPNQREENKRVVYSTQRLVGVKFLINNLK